MINTLYLKLALSRTNLHGPKGVRAIEVLLYSVIIHRELHMRKEKTRVKMLI